MYKRTVGYFHENESTFNAKYAMIHEVFESHSLAQKMMLSLVYKSKNQNVSNGTGTTTVYVSYDAMQIDIQQATSGRGIIVGYFPTMKRLEGVESQSHDDVNHQVHRLSLTKAKA